MTGSMLRKASGPPAAGARWRRARPAKPVIRRSIRPLEACAQQPRGLEVVRVICIKKRIDLADREVHHCEGVARGEGIDLAHALLDERMAKRGAIVSNSLAVVYFVMSCVTVKVP